MRSGGVATIVAFGLVVGACSTGGASSGGSKDEVCALVARLDETASTVAKADVSDPTVFEKTMDDAAKEYVDTVRALRRLVPDRVQGDLDRLEAAVEQRDFGEAFDARRALDSDDTTACTGSTTPTTD